MKIKLLKLFAAVVACACVLGCFSVAAAGDFAVTVGTLDKTLNIVPGDQIVVPVYITDNPGVYSYVFDFTYDNEVLTADTAKMSSLLGRGDYKCVINDFTINDKGGKLRTVSLHSGGVDTTENGVAVYLFFTVKDTAKGGFSDISVSYTDKNVVNYSSKGLTPKTVSGGVYITAETAQAGNDDNNASSATASGNSDGDKIKGYVPPATLPNEAASYYKSQKTVQQAVESKQKVAASNKAETVEPVETIGEQDNTELTESGQTDTDDDANTAPKSNKLPVIVLAVCGLVLVGATIVFLIKREREI